MVQGSHTNIENIPENSTLPASDTPGGSTSTWKVPTMQAYGSADVAMAAEPRPLDLRSAAPGSESKVSPSAFALEAMLSQLADLVAARVQAHYEHAAH